MLSAIAPAQRHPSSYLHYCRQIAIVRKRHAVGRSFATSRDRGWIAILVHSSQAFGEKIPRLETSIFANNILSTGPTRSGYAKRRSVTCTGSRRSIRTRSSVVSMLGAALPLTPLLLLDVGEIISGCLVPKAQGLPNFVEELAIRICCVRILSAACGWISILAPAASFIVASPGDLSLGRCFAALLVM